MSGLEALLLGRTLGGRYRTDALIARGGMGVVYRATDLRLEREVALKVVSSADGSASHSLRARFGREARAAASLHDPHVVQVHDYGTDPELDLDYLVMELLQGRDLARAITESGGAIAPERAVQILAEAAAGLAAGHGRGLVHRDVKPGNLYLVEENGRFAGVKVLDFGIAQPPPSLDGTLERLTQYGPGPQSPRFASPEQRDSAGLLTPATDVFSLGRTILEALGIDPASSDPQAWTAIWIRRGMDPRRAQRLAELLGSMTAYQPSQRPPSGAEVERQARALMAPLRGLANPRRKRARSGGTAGGVVIAACLTAVATAGILRGPELAKKYLWPPAPETISADTTESAPAAMSSDSLTVDTTPALADSALALPDTGLPLPEELARGFQELLPPSEPPATDSEGRVWPLRWVWSAGFGVRFETCNRAYEEGTSYLTCTFDIQNGGSVEFGEPIYALLRP